MRPMARPNHKYPSDGRDSHHKLAGAGGGHQASNPATARSRFPPWDRSPSVGRNSTCMKDNAGRTSQLSGAQLSLSAGDKIADFARTTCDVALCPNRTSMPRNAVK
jgi:hypothetical protein